MEGCKEDNSNEKERTQLSSGSSGSDSGSTEEEERLRRLFTACDRDGDGFIDNQDLRYMCEQLNLEDAVEEIMQQLGVDETGTISFQDFMQCRQRLSTEIEQEKLRVDTSTAWMHTDSENSSGMPPSSQDYDSGARDMSHDLSPEPVSMYTLLEKHNPEYLQQVMNTQYGPAVLEITNSLHLTALTSLKSELTEVNNRLQKLRTDKEHVDKQLAKYKSENLRQQEQYGDKLEEITCRYEDRITELHSVIAELRKKLDHKQFNIIREEDETEESDGVKSQSQEGSISINENLSLNDSLSVNDNLSVTDNNAANQSTDVSADTGPLDWETEMSQVINKFNKALMDKHQQQSNASVNLNQPRVQPSTYNNHPVGQPSYQPAAYSHGYQQQRATSTSATAGGNYSQSNATSSSNNSGSVGPMNLLQQQNIGSNNPGLYVNTIVGQQHLQQQPHSSCGTAAYGHSVSFVHSGGSNSTPVTLGGQSRAGPTNTTVTSATQAVFTTPPYSQLRSSSQQSVHSSHTQQMEGEPTSDPCNSQQNPQLMSKLSSDNHLLKEQIRRLETELHHTHKQLHSVRDERENLKNKVQDLQRQLSHSRERSSSQGHIHTPSKLLNSPVYNKSGMDVDRSPSFPKIAELKKLKTASSENQILGVDIMSSLANAKVAEHLVQNLQESSSIQEIIHSASTSKTTISENKIHEFEIEVERLQSKIDHLKAQNELLAIALEESKGHCDRMTELVGKCESNQTALNLAVGMGDQLVESMDAIISLLDSELSLLLANCRAVGLGSTATTDSGMGDESCDEIMDVTERAKSGRRSAEQVAKQLLSRLDRLYGSGAAGSGSQTQAGVTSPWEELSSTSRTTSTTSSIGSASDAEFTKNEEHRLKQYMKHLKEDRTSIKLTVMELQSVHIDPDADKPPPLPEGQRLDLENAVLMQELMAMKEDKAELRAQNYLLEKEKAALDLQLCGKESQEQAYIVQIEHLKSEITEWKQKLGHDVKTKKDDDTATPSITLAELKSMGMDSSEMAQDLADALKREQLLRKRVSELMATLERLSQNSETRHKQSAEFVSDLKKANSALVSAFEKTKKKYQSKLKKIEIQLQETTETYEAQISSLKENRSKEASPPVEVKDNTAANSIT